MTARRCASGFGASGLIAATEFGWPAFSSSRWVKELPEAILSKKDISRCVLSIYN